MQTRPQPLTRRRLLPLALGAALFGLSLPTQQRRSSAARILWAFQTDDGLIVDAVIAGSVYASGSLLTEGTITRGTIYVLDATTGQERWRFGGSGIAELARVAADTVYAVDESRRDDGSRAYALHGLNARDGGERWRIELGGGKVLVQADEDGHAFVWAYGAEPMGGNLRALDAASGAEYWRLTFVDDPVPYGGRIADGVVYTFLSEPSPSFLALAAAIGAERWRVSAIGAFVNVTILGDLVLLPTTHAVRALGTAAGDELWRFAPAAPLTRALVASDSVFAVAGDALFALAVADGTGRWQAAIGRAADPRLVVGSTLCVLDGSAVRGLDAADGTELWRVPIDPRYGVIAGSPDGRTVYVYADRAMIALDAESAAERWRISFGDPLPGSVQAFADRLYLSHGGALYAVTTGP